VARVPGAAPTITGVDLDLSFAYAGSSVLIAVSQHRSIGIDAEQNAARVDETLIRHALTARELEALERMHSSARQEAFLRTWVRKEAVLKAAGVGLLVEPAGVHTGIGPLTVEPVVVPGNGAFRVVDLVIPGFVAAVAAGGPAPVHTRWCVTPPLGEEPGLRTSPDGRGTQDEPAEVAAVA
jgi:4'-phosphopantetheinyl transferase